MQATARHDITMKMLDSQADWFDEVHPNHDEAAGRPYAKSFVEFEPKE